METNEGGLIDRPTEYPAQQQIKQPTCGRVVHFFPFTSRLHPQLNPFGGQTKLPAIVQEDNDTYPTLSVLTGNPANPVFVVKTVYHKSVVQIHASDEPIADPVFSSGYWEWPEIK